MSIIILQTPSQHACEPCTNGLHTQKFSLHAISNTRYIGIAERRPQNIFYVPLVILNLIFFNLIMIALLFFFHSQRVRKIPLKISSWCLYCLIWRVNFTLPWGPEDIFFSLILIVCGEAASTRRKAYQTVSTVYFILGVLRTDHWSQGNFTRIFFVNNFFFNVNNICENKAPSTRRRL